MAFFTRFSKLDLPIYGSETPIASHPYELRACTDSSTDTFVRTVGIPDFNRTPIHTLLDVADEYFGLLAIATGANIVEHTWGMYKIPKSLPRDRRQDLRHRAGTIGMPRQHILVAEVEIIDELQWPSATSVRAIHTATQLLQVEYHRGHWRDGKIEQFSDGTSRKSGKQGTYLLDIEPRFDVRK